MKRWQVIADLCGALQRLYGDEAMNREYSPEDASAIEDEVGTVLHQLVPPKVPSRDPWLETR